MTKKIDFVLLDKKWAEFVTDPLPAIEVLPEWYKKSGPYTAGRMKSFGHDSYGLTVKKCVPFLDALSSGYIITLSADVFVDPNDSDQFFTWSAYGVRLVDAHNFKQLGEYKQPNEYFRQPFKWINPWIISTPRGYSVEITHPVNRPELPFHTLTGVVDTDTFDMPINFPFMLKKGFTGIIERGTPIAQVVPFKRENWKVSVNKDNDLVEVDRINKYRKYAINAYRKMSWVRKSYR